MDRSILDYVEIVKAGDSAFDTCAESIAERMKNKNVLLIQSVFLFAETDVPFAMRLVRDGDDVSISFADADWQFYRISEDCKTYEFCRDYIPNADNLTALELFDSLTSGLVIKLKSSIQDLKGEIAELLNSEYAFDEDSVDEEHELSYFVIYEE